MSLLPAVSRLTDVLTAAGYPVQCVSTNVDGTFTVTLDETGTPAQQLAVNTLVATYIDSPRVPLPLKTIIQNVQALTTQQQLKLLSVVCALAIQDNPALGALVGVTVVGDQPAS